MSRFLRIFAIFFSLVFVGNAFGAGYTCSNKRYTYCAAGYYLNGTSAGNSCSACSSVRNSAVQSVTSQSCSTSCSDSCSTSCSVNCGVNATCPTGYSCEYNADTCSGTQYGTKYGTKYGSQSVTKTCNGYYTGGTAGSSGTSQCSGCSSTTTSYGTCGNYGSCGSYGACGNYGACSVASSSCTCTIKKQTCNTPCTSVSNTSSTQSCTPSNTVANAKTTSCPAGTQTCNGRYTNSNCSSAGQSCSGCSSWGGCSTSCFATSCKAGFYLDNGVCKTAPSGWTCPDGNKGVGECYKTCSAYDSGGYRYTPKATTVYYNNSCEYTSACITSCTSVSNRTSTQSGTESCTRSCSIANGTCSYSGSTRTYTNTCNGYYTGGGCSSAGATCTGCSSYTRTSTGTCGGGEITITCNAGYYLSNGACVKCEAGYYCPGNNARGQCTGLNYSGAGQQYCSTCPNSATGYYSWDGNSLNDSVYECYKNVPYTATYGSGTQNCYYTSGSGSSAVYAGNSSVGCDTRKITSCTTDYYLASSGYSECSFVGNGYYSANGSTSYGTCTGLPNNAYWTSSGGGSNNCSWACNANYYKSGSSCVSCTSVSYTDSGSDTETITGGTRTRSKSRTCYRSTSSAGSTSSSACSGTSSCGSWSYGDWTYSCTTPGYYKNSSGTCSQCEAGNYCSGGVKTACGGGKWSAAGASSCNDCPADYPNSDAGAKAITSCYSGTKKRDMTSCTQNACSNPDTTGCSDFTCAASCSCAGTTCDYVAYSNSAGTGDGTIKSGCSTNAQSCTKAVASLTAKTNYYVNGTTSCPACSSFSSTYKLSDGGNISSNYCYQTVTKTGSQNDPAMPTGCAKRTLSACTPGSCSYKDYYNATDGSCTPTNCVKGQTCTSASADYYLDSGVAKLCSAYSATYPDSDGGNIDYKSCYKTVTKTGNQNNGATPAGCASVTAWNTCTPGTCSYKDYNGATDGSCTPTDCTKDPKTVTAKANYYVSGVTCPACPTAYPSSDGGNIGEGNCFVTKTNTGSQKPCSQPANSASYTCGTCPPGTCNWRDYKSATDTTCTPEDCYKPVASVTCNTGYYTSGVTCPACTNKPDNSAYTGTATSNACPWSCNTGYGQTSADQCAQICTAGFQHLKSSTGVSIPLYTSAQTTHSIVVKSQSGDMCYASLESGAAPDAINVNLGGTTYHAIK